MSDHRAVLPSAKRYAFARLNALLRKAAEGAVAGLWDAIGRLVDLITQAECANMFAGAGYGTA